MYFLTYKTIRNLISRIDNLDPSFALFESFANMFDLFTTVGILIYF